MTRAAALTIFYNQGGQKFELEQSLQPDEQMWIDLGKLIREHVPDKNGKTLPADLTSGTYEIRDLTNHAFGTLFEAKVIYDKTYGHVTYGCNQCCGYTTPILAWYNPLNIPIGSTADNGVLAYEPCIAGYDDVSTYFYSKWSSNNTGIATVDAYGTHHGVAVGSTTSNVLYAPLPNNDIRLNCPNSMFGPSPPSDSVKPKILLGGSNGTNITNTTQSVVVGQQIVLYGSYTLPSGYTFTSLSWSVPGTTVGGFSASLSSGATTPTNFNQQSTTFYWVTAASSQQVTFTLNYKDNNNNSQTATATATFNIAGPTSASVATQLGQVVITSQPALSLGNFPSTPGIQFTASATPPSGYSNSFEWVQIITNDTKVITLNDNTTTTCVPATTPAGGLPFLDTTYPYDTSNPTNDTPDTVLDPTQFKELTRNFSATMYLLWKPGLQNSIFVPLGTVGWQWSGDAVYNAGNQTWTLNSSSKNANSFSASSTYPTWSRYSDYSGPSCH